MDKENKSPSARIRELDYDYEKLVRESNECDMCIKLRSTNFSNYCGVHRDKVFALMSNRTENVNANAWFLAQLGEVDSKVSIIEDGDDYVEGKRVGMKFVIAELRRRTEEK
jgi:hypothetical protein